MRAVFRMPGSSDAGAASSCAAFSISANGAQGTPLAMNCCFSTPRSWHRATLSADGATGRCAPSVYSAEAGTFSNSVVIAELRCINCARPGSPR